MDNPEQTISRSRFQRITARVLGKDYSAAYLASLIEIDTRTAQRLGRENFPVTLSMLTDFAERLDAKGFATLAEAYRQEVKRQSV